MDGTLSDPRWRMPLLEQGLWKEFLSRCGEDSPRPEVVEMMRDAVASTNEVFVVSARPEWTRFRTLIWLRSHVFSDFENTRLVLRQNWDFRPDEEVKRDMLRKGALPSDRVLRVVDDRPKVLRMWEKELPNAVVLNVGSGQEF
jgi:hypothetical protein